MMTIGVMLQQWLTKLDWFSTLFPRIPVPIQKQIETRMANYYRQHNINPATKTVQSGDRYQGDMDRRQVSGAVRGGGGVGGGGSGRDMGGDRRGERDRFDRNDRYESDRYDRNDRNEAERYESERPDRFEADRYDRHEGDRYDRHESKRSNRSRSGSRSREKHRR